MSGLWGPIMFGGALALIFTGYPVAFALAGTAMLFALLGWMTGAFDPILFTCSCFKNLFLTNFLRESLQVSRIGTR